MYLLQIISIIIYSFVVFFATRDFKRTVLIWVPFSFLFNPQVCVLYTSPITALTVAVDLSLVMLYFLYYRINQFKSQFYSEKFFFSSAIKLMVLSYIISSFFSVIPFGSSFNRLIKTTVDNFGIIYLLYRCLNTKEDVLLFIKCFCISAIIFCSNGIIEGLIGENLWGDFVFYNSRCDETTLGRGWHYPNFISGGNVRFGMLRCYSFFNLHIAYGFACCLVLFVLLIIFNQGNKIFNGISQSYNKMIYYLLFLMLFLSIIFCNSKGPMLMVIFILLTQYSVSSLLRPMVLFSLVLLVCIILLYFPEYLYNFLSLSDEELAEEGGGSTMQTRQEQFATAYELFVRNPLVGNGIGSTTYLRQYGFEEIRGAESAWLKVLPDQGILGAIAYLYMFKSLYDGAKQIMPRKIYFYYLLAVFIFDFTNGSAYTRLIWWIGVFLVIRRYYQIKEEESYC